MQEIHVPVSVFIHFDKVFDTEWHALGCMFYFVIHVALLNAKQQYTQVYKLWYFWFASFLGCQGNHAVFNTRLHIQRRTALC